MHAAAGLVGNLLEDAVAVRLPLDERQQDEKVARLDREVFGRLVGWPMRHLASLLGAGAPLACHSKTDTSLSVN